MSTSTTTTIKLGKQVLAAEFLTDTAKAEERVVGLTWYSGAAVKRTGWEGSFQLAFSMDPAHVRMGRFQSGRAPLLDAHQDYGISNQVGVITHASIDNGIGRATAKISQRPEVDGLWKDIQDGIVRNVSMGAAIHKLKETTVEGAATKSYVAVDWEPMEASVVPIGADASASITALADEQTFDCEVEATASQGAVMPEGTLSAEAERSRVVEIGKVGKVAKLAQEQIDFAVSNGMPLEQFRDVCLQELYRRGNIGGEINSYADLSGANRDNRSGLVERMAEALACRFSGAAPSDAARPFVGARIVDLAKVLCQQHGLNVRHAWDNAEVIRLAHTTSDFPAMLMGAGERMLLQAYAASQPALKQVARRSSVNDFRTKSAIRLGEAPALLKVLENGELHQGSRGEVAESYRAFTFGRIFSITREALVNDSLDAFGDFTRAYGVAAATLEGKLLSDLLTSNPAMSDGQLLFSAAHNNVSTGAGSALGIAGLSAARLALRTMTGIDNSTILDIPPVYLVVPASLETTAQQLLVATNYSPTDITDVNPFQQSLTLVVDPRLDATSTTAWYLFGSPQTNPTLEYSYLGDQQGPIVETRPGWEILGMEFRAILDIGVGAIDFRGAIKSNGS